MDVRRVLAAAMLAAVPMGAAARAAGGLVVEPPDLDFGSVPVGESDEQTLTVRNESADDITVFGATISEGDDGFEVLRDECAGMVLAGTPDDGVDQAEHDDGEQGGGTAGSDSCRIVVSFRPEVTGTHVAEITVDSDVGPEFVTLEGTATPSSTTVPTTSVPPPPPTSTIPPPPTTNIVPTTTSEPVGAPTTTLPDDPPPLSREERLQECAARARQTTIEFPERLTMHLGQPAIVSVDIGDRDGSAD